MSEFECRKGHLMNSGETFCKECGGRIAKMDGMTNRQLRAEENDYERNNEENEEEE